MARNFFFKEFEIDGAQTTYNGAADLDFCFTALNVMIVNDSNVRVKFSFRRPKEDGVLNECDRAAFDKLGEGKLWLKLENASPNKKIVRVWAWRM